MTRVLERGTSNPMIVVSRDEVLEFLRAKADEAGFADRESCAVQITVEYEFGAGLKYHHEVPELLIMVSNIPNSRKPV